MMQEIFLYDIFFVNIVSSLSHVSTKLGYLPVIHDILVSCNKIFGPGKKWS